MDYESLRKNWIKSEEDLFLIDHYRAVDRPTQDKAKDMYIQGVNLNDIVDFCKKRKMTSLAKSLKDEANLSKRFKTRTFDNFTVNSKEQEYAYKRAKEYANNIDENLKNGTGLIFVGNGCVGTGKTHLACAIANNLLDRNYPVKVINVTKMIYQMKEDFKVDQYVKVPILLIDDLGKETGTQWVCEMLYMIFNERYENMKPTIITTENGLDDIRKNYIVKDGDQIIDKGKSIVSRLTEDFIYIPLTGEDYRQRRAS